MFCSLLANYIETQYYWTATTDAADPTAAWTIYSCDFGLYDIPKSSVGYTLAVRQVFLASDKLKSFYPFPGPCDPNHTVL